MSGYPLLLNQGHLSYLPGSRNGRSSFARRGTLRRHEGACPAWPQEQCQPQAWHSAQQQQWQNSAEWRPQHAFASVDSTEQGPLQQQRQEQQLDESLRSNGHSNVSYDSDYSNGSTSAAQQQVMHNEAPANEESPDFEAHQESPVESPPKAWFEDRLSNAAQQLRPGHPRPSLRLRRTWYRRFLGLCGLRPSNRHDTAIWALAVPALLALATDPLLGIVDTAFVGRLGPEELVRPIRSLDVPGCYTPSDLAHCL